MSELLASRPEVAAFGGGPSAAPAGDATAVDTTEPTTETAKPVKGEPAGAAERGPDGKFLPRDGAKAEPKPAKVAKTQAPALEPEASEPEPEEEEAKEESEEESKEEKPAESKELSKEDFLALAKKHGFELDRAGRVTTAERHKFREEKRQQSEQIEQRARGYQQQLQGYMAELDAKQAEFAARETRVSAFDKAIEAGDFDAAAVAAGRKDWQSLQQEMLDRISDPTYKQLVEMQKWKDEQEQQKEEQQRAWQRQQEEQREQAARTEQAKVEHDYKQQLSQQMASSKDPIVAAMHDDPVFIETMFQYQRKHFDADSGTAPSPEALIRRDEGGIRAGLEKLHTRLGRALGAPPAPAAREAVESSPEATRAAALAPAAKSPPKQPSAKGSVGPSVAGKIDPNSPEWFARWDEKFRQNREAERKGR
jgi:hypothetical protein